MKKITKVLLLAMMVLFVMATAAFAEDGADIHSMGYLAAALAIGIAAHGTGIGQGVGVSKAVEGIARNPSAAGKIQTVLIIGLAMIESLAIYALVVSLIILFVKW